MATLSYTRPWVYEKQRAAIFSPLRYAVTEASTKAGKTVGCLIWFFEQGLQGSAGQNFWWVAPSYRQTKIAYRRLKFFLRRHQETFTPNESDLTITLINGATLWFVTGEKPDNLYGEDVYAAVIDEATRVREEAWHAIRTTLTATRGPVRIIGNVKGRKNWAYVMARKAEAGAPEMHYAKLIAKDAIDAGILSADEVEDARQQLPESVFNELYNAIPSEDEGNPFGAQHIRACVERYVPGGTPVLWGWDLARSVDFTFGVALDSDQNVCRIERFQDSWTGTKARIHAVVGRTPAIIEVNGPGDQLLEDLAKLGPDYRGFTTTGISKQQIMEGLAVGIQQHAVGIPDGVLRRELDSFEYVVRRSSDGRVRTFYAAPEGLHDDGVMALAIAWHHIARVPPLVQPLSLTQVSKWR